MKFNDKILQNNKKSRQVVYVLFYLTATRPTVAVNVFRRRNNNNKKKNLRVKYWNDTKNVIRFNENI